MDSQDSPPKPGATNGGANDGDRATTVLVVRVSGRTCALRIQDVIETMRPLPIQPLTGAPEMVRGLSLIRGEPVVVVALGEVFGDSGSHFERFILTRTGERQVALAVDSVVGVRRLPESSLASMPPLLRESKCGAVDAIASLDADFLYFLNSTHAVPEELWAELDLKNR